MSKASPSNAIEMKPHRVEDVWEKYCFFEVGETCCAGCACETQLILFPTSVTLVPGRIEHKVRPSHQSGFRVCTAIRKEVLRTWWVLKVNIQSLMLQCLCHWIAKTDDKASIVYIKTILFGLLFTGNLLSQSAYDIFFKKKEQFKKSPCVRCDLARVNDIDELMHGLGS